MTSGLDDHVPTGPAAGKPVESLRRELLAILFLYAAVAVLPFLIGMALAP
jgi:hypothetical protein